MSNLFDILSGYAFSGVPSNAVYDLIKKAWQTVTHKTWEELYLGAFQTALEEARPFLAKYVREDGVIAIDQTELQQIFHQELDIDATTFSELNSDEFVSRLAQVMVDRSILIIGGHPLSNQDYAHLILNLLDQVKVHFKQSVLSDSTILNRVLLEESLKNQTLAEETVRYLGMQFDLVLSKLEVIEAKIDQFSEERTVPIAQLAKEISTQVSTNTTSALTSEYQSELDYAKELINSYKPKQALEYLESLKNRIEHHDQPIVKYRLLANMGAARLSMNQPLEAAKLFIQAVTFNRSDENALYYAALGYALLEQYDEARRLVHQIIKNNPTHERAYTVLVQVYPGENLDTLIKKVPVFYRNSHSIAYALSHVARQQLDFERAEYWLQVALKQDSDSFETKAAYAALLLQLIDVDAWLIYTRQFDDEDKKKLQKADQFLTEAWERITNTELRNFRPDIVINRSTTRRLLNRLDEAIQDADTAIQINSRAPGFIQLRAALAYESNDRKKAIELLETIIEAEETSEAPISLADILREVGEYDRAIEIANRFLERNSDSPLLDAAHRIIVRSYIESKNAERMIEIFNSIQAKETKSLTDLINAATIADFLGEKAVSVKLLHEAKNQIDASTSRVQILEVADGFYSLGEFGDAAQLYEIIVNPMIDTPYTRTLIRAYYYSGQNRKALNLCQILHQSEGISEFIYEMEAMIQESIGNLAEAKRIYQEYVANFPNNILTELRLALINYRLLLFDELDRFLESLIDIEELPFEAASQLIDLYGIRGFTKNFFEALYRIRKKFYDKSIAHVQYVTSFFNREKSSNSYLVCSHVCVGSVVYLQDESGQISWFVIEDKENADFRYHEIGLEDSRTQKLLNKVVGDEVVFKEDYISKDVRKVIEVTSKYIYALRESVNLLNKQFSETPGFWTLRVDLEECTSGLPKNLEAVLNKSNEPIQEAEKLYKTGHIPVGTFAKIAGKDIPSTWGYLSSSLELGIRCCQGSQEERSQAISLLTTQPLKLIIDIISLLTLHNLGAADVVVSAFGQLGVAQSTIDVLQNIVEDCKGMKSGGTAFLGMKGDQFFLHEVTADEVQRSREYFEGIISWISNNCEILPCTAALDMEHAERQELEKLVGTPFVDTLLIASEPGNLLYSDDWAIRQVAKARFGLDGVWTQAVILRCQELTALDQSEYSEIVVKLVRSNYRYTSIDGNALIAAAKQAEWLPNEPFISLLNILENTQSSNSLILNAQADRISLSSVLRVAVDFLYRLWEQNISVQRKYALGINLINSLVHGRNNLNFVLNALALEVRRKSIIILPYESDILSLIHQWRNHYFV
jgi:tetratricopeptide (TPR) repeat protein